MNKIAYLNKRGVISNVKVKKQAFIFIQQMLFKHRVHDYLLIIIFLMHGKVRIRSKIHNV